MYSLRAVRGVLCSCNNNLIHNGFHHHYPQSYVMLCVLSVSAATMNRWQIKPSIFSIYLSPHWQSFKFNWRLSNIFVTVAVLIFIFKYFYDTNVALWRSRWCNWLSAPVFMMTYTTRVTLNTPLDHGINTRTTPWWRCRGVFVNSLVFIRQSPITIEVHQRRWCSGAPYRLSKTCKI